ncbi:MAG TPA: site-2 protease family protein [Thermoplasmata archaeon]|nr:site-2 protease family protein [Thermoplasmata archaeon]
MAKPLFPPPSQAKDELTKLLARIEKQFKVLDVRYRPPEGVAFHVSVKDDEIETRFESVRRDLVADGFVPFITREEGGVFILVGKMPARRFAPLWANHILFFATIATTILAGSTSWVFYTSQLPDTVGIGEALGAIFAPGNLALGGLTFALPLMLILGLHELGHYFMARRHGVKASLPFFLPLPPIISPLGTLGAFISVREPIPSRKALMDIGVTGPLVGFFVTIPVLLIGLQLTMMEQRPAPQDIGSAVGIGTSLLFAAIAMPFNIPESVQLHPTAFAGWVGLLVTSLNLLPASQLDGGHVARALFGDRSRYLSIASFVVLIILGIAFVSWWIFAIFILIFGLRHPPPLNDITPLDFRRKLMGWSGIIILVVAFVPVPMQAIEPTIDVAIEERGIGGWSREMDWNQTPSSIDFRVRNTGNTAFRVNVSLDEPPIFPWSLVGFVNDTGENKSTISRRLAVNETLNLSLRVQATWNSTTLNSTVLVRKIVVKREISETDMRPIKSQEVTFRIRKAGHEERVEPVDFLWPGVSISGAVPSRPPGTAFSSSVLTFSPSRRCAA